MEFFKYQELTKFVDSMIINLIINEETILWEEFGWKINFSINQN